VPTIHHLALAATSKHGEDGTGRDVPVAVREAVCRVRCAHVLVCISRRHFFPHSKTRICFVRCGQKFHCGASDMQPDDIPGHHHGRLSGQCIFAVTPFCDPCLNHADWIAKPFPRSHLSEELRGLLFLTCRPQRGVGKPGCWLGPQ
jgi:hypothetical protein